MERLTQSGKRADLIELDQTFKCLWKIIDILGNTFSSIKNCQEDSGSIPKSTFEIRIQNKIPVMELKLFYLQGIDAKKHLVIQMINSLKAEV